MTTAAVGDLFFLFVRLDLDKWIYEPPSESEDEFKSNDLTFMLTSGATDTHTYNGTSPALRTKKKKRRGKKGGEEEEEEDEDEEMAKVHT